MLSVIVDTPIASVPFITNAPLGGVPRDEATGQCCARLASNSAMSHAASS
jgi:hypothetical protein